LLYFLEFFQHSAISNVVVLSVPFIHGG
jgi:hypothetical protein